ncbi:hypothetical protein KEM48_010534 [Puccinia striiformis f. sp. tritici PST-130]|nr:hypothetical protein KEM48_010534 [Puccinia striiformis f. sp. tritici PST-130]
MNITSLGTFFVVIVTLAGSTIATCDKEIAYAYTHCSTSGCTNWVKKGQYTYRCNKEDCPESDCGKIWTILSKKCTACKAIKKR